MIILYDKFKTSGFHRNDLVLRNTTKCEVTWEKNGQYQIDLVYPIISGDITWQSIVKGSIVKCPVPYQQDQLFRLNTPTKKMDENGTYFYIEATGYHITYDLSANFLEDVRPTAKNGIEAGQYILDNTQYPHQFSWIGNITSINTAYYIRKNVINALIGDDNQAYVNRWGGELVRDNFNIGMYKQAGENNGIVIKYSKNLTGFEQSADDSNMITRAMPYITDDSTSSDDTTSTQSNIVTPVITLPEKYIDSPKINEYATIYVKDVEVTLTDDQKNLSTGQKYQVMRDYVNNLYDNSNVDVPLYSYSVNFIELSKTEEYKDYAVLEEVHPYDFIVVRALDIDVIAELVGYTYDSVAKKYEEVTLGNVRNDIIRSNQKSLFQISQQNQQSIKILQAQMGDIPNSIQSIATTTNSGGNNLFDHSILEDKHSSEWITTGAMVVEDDSLHDTDKVWQLPPNTSISKNAILVNPNNYHGKQLMFSLQAKYSNLTIIDSGEYNVPTQTNVLLGALDAAIKRCIVDTTGTTWNYNSGSTGIISEKIAVTENTAITITNTQNYPYTIHCYDNQGNQLADFTTGPIPSNASNITVEILESMPPLSLVGFSIFETNPYTSEGISFLYANKTDCDWTVQEQNFYLTTEHPSDIIQSINFRATNGDANGTVYIAAFMINTGTVRSDFSQSSNDTVETLRTHQIYADYIEAKQADIDNLHVTNETVTNLNASVANIMDLTAGTLKAGIITADSAVIATGAITNALIGKDAVQTSQIADGSITDAKIITLTANKISAGTIDASVITVTNLNCANLTVGSINGTQIATGAIDITKLTNSLNSTITNASNDASSALTSANGKNKNYYGPTAPTGTLNAGDQWFDTANGNRISRWSGTAWVLTQFGSLALTALDAGVITTGTLNASSVTITNLSANSINGGAINAAVVNVTNLNATNISSGTLSVDRLSANTITGDKLVVDTITAREIASHVITANEILTNTITASEIKTGTITATSGTISSLSASVLTTGTLNAGIVNVINLNASNITTGTLTADKISGGTLKLGGLTSGVEIVKNASNQEIARLDTDGLTITLQTTSTGLFGNAFRIQAYNGTTLLNIDGDGQLIYAGVFSVDNGVSATGSTLINNGNITQTIGSSVLTMSPVTGIYCPGAISASGFKRISDGAWGVLSRNIDNIYHNGGALNWVSSGTDYWVFPSGSSDERLKSGIISSTENCLETINNISIVQYSFIENGEYVNVGVTSQQMGSINQNFMQPFMTRDNVDYYAPNWDRVMPYIVGSIQEENKDLEALKLRVIEIEKQLTELQG